MKEEGGVEGGEVHGRNGLCQVRLGTGRGLKPLKKEKTSLEGREDKTKKEEGYQQKETLWLKPPQDRIQTQPRPSRGMKVDGGLRVSTESMSTSMEAMNRG